jgi:CubicO group peptidase (beta-lactamase class C family)
MSITGSGFSSKRLQNVDALLQRIVDTKQAAGASAYIIRHGVEAYCNSFGMQDIEKGIPLQNDSIHRIYSMTKTFTIVTAMTLYEKGLFKLHDPIAEFLPAFSNVKVAQPDERGIVQLVPAKNPITFEHLFTMTSGIPYSDKIARPTTLGAANSAAKLPLSFHPGEYWMYGFSHDILGALIEVITGKRLSEYMAEVILEPLGLTNTAFYVPEEKRHRLSKAYDVTPGDVSDKKYSVLSEKTDLGEVPFAPPQYESGGGGLMSTLHDVGRYGLMLLGNGKLDGERVLSRKTIDLIRQNHTQPSQNLPRFGFPSMAGYGYGLGVRTMMDTSLAGLNGSPGEWAWDGMLGTWYCVDPTEDMVAVFLVQRSPGGNEDLPKRFAQTVYGAIDD